MTIAAGFHMHEGILLCADTQYTGGSKVNQPKLFGYEFEREGKLVLAFALSGHEIYGKTAIEECVDALSSCKPQELTFRKAWRLLRSAVKSVHAEYVDSRPDPSEKENARFDLVIGCWLPHGGGLHLFRSSGPGVTFGDDYYCVGIGAYLGDYMMKDIFSPNMLIPEVGLLAIQALAAVKSYDANCGGDTQIRVIYPNGGLGIPVGYTNVAHIETHIQAFEAQTRRLLFQLGDLRVTGLTAKLTGLANSAQWESDIAFEQNLVDFSNEMRSIRATWRTETFDRFTKLLRDLTGRQDPESPKADL